MPIKKLTVKEIYERRGKGLCFECDDKFGHSIVIKYYLYIQACFNDNNADEVEIEGEKVHVFWPLSFFFVLFW